MAHLKITTENFGDEVENYKGLVLVDFGAEWCGPCRMLGPVIEELSEEVKDVKVGKLNVDDSPEIAGRFNVMSIPTVILFKDGQIIETLIGVRAKQEYLNLIEANK
jgi:thioredoxin 1